MKKQVRNLVSILFIVFMSVQVLGQLDTSDCVLPNLVWYSCQNMDSCSYADDDLVIATGSSNIQGCSEVHISDGEIKVLLSRNHDGATTFVGNGSQSIVLIQDSDGKIVSIHQYDSCYYKRVSLYKTGEPKSVFECDYSDGTPCHSLHYNVTDVLVREELYSPLRDKSHASATHIGRTLLVSPLATKRFDDSGKLIDIEEYE